MNSLDRDLLEDAGSLFARIMGEGETKLVGEIHNWLARAARAGLLPADVPTGDQPVQNRWRDIDPAGEVATEPTPDPPDEPDEGETGPPELQG